MSEAVNITSLRKKGRRFAAEVSGGGYTHEKVLFHADAVVVFGLSAGMAFPEERWAEIIRENDFKLAWERALRILSSGDCDSRGLRRKLLGKGFSAESAERVAAEASRLRLIDDAAFLKRKAEACLARGYGRLKALSKLLQGGAPKEEAEAVLDAVYADDAELEAAEAAARRKMASLERSGGDARGNRAKLSRHLAGKGFSYEIVSRVLESIAGG